MTKKSYINIEIDKLTNSIEDAVTGESYDTEFVAFTKADQAKFRKRNWEFDWVGEANMDDRKVFKLTIKNDAVIQGMVSFSIESDHIYMHLIESVRFNRGKEKLYVGVPGNMVAFLCKLSLELGYSGFVAFDAKTKLVKHYQETLFATHFRGSRMIINGNAAQNLIKQYFKK